ncbi:hypothetical protein NDU88_009073 [Pleurodeles waltl]|uniref:Protein SET n=1 Tax=Pleurodeles waltl TaxID=8319 RepID=A0AAV7QWL1_PLEWA|nr:hypothetical protein NDU88_009073 [Pleurodeles waltl]
MAPTSKTSKTEVSCTYHEWGEDVSDQEQQDTVGQLEKVQGDINKLDRQGSSEILKINIKYNNLCQPLFQRRSELISKIPQFWSTALLGHPRLRQLLEEVDKEVLHYLTRIRLTDSEDSYRMEFHFEENPYFENRVLSKEFRQKEGREVCIKSTEIKWKAGEGLTRCRCQMERNGLKRKRKTGRQGSVFYWFTDNCGASEEFWEIIKNEIWPNPLLYYVAPDESNAEGDEMSEATELYCSEPCHGESFADAEVHRGDRNEEDDGCRWRELQWEF